MTSVDEAARDAARAKGSENKARMAARAERRREAVLDRRARGMKVEGIAFTLKAEVEDVKAIIEEARRAGDPRALTGRQSDRAIEARAALDAPIEERKAAPAIPAESADTPGRQPTGPRDAGAPLSRLRFVNALREMADECRTRSPKASGGLHHLADLHELCDRFYPSLLIASEGATLASTERQFPRSTAAPMSSPAQACVEG